MQTTIDSVREIIQTQPLIEEALKLDILNLSQYAKLIQQEVSQKNFKQTKIGAIVTALSRLKEEITDKFEVKFKVNDISLKYPLTEIAYITAADHVQKTGDLYKLFSQKQNHFLNIITGNTETAIFVNSNYEKDVLASFAPYKPIKVINNLAAVSLKFSEEYLEVLGITYRVLKNLLWNKVNLVEIISTYTEISLIISKSDSQKAFQELSREFID